MPAELEHIKEKIKEKNPNLPESSAWAIATKVWKQKHGINPKQHITWKKMEKEGAIAEEAVRLGRGKKLIPLKSKFTEMIKEVPHVYHKTEALHSKEASSTLSRLIRNPQMRGELSRFIEPYMGRIGNLWAGKALESGVAIPFTKLPTEAQLHWLRKWIPALGSEASPLEEKLMKGIPTKQLIKKPQLSFTPVTA